VVVLVVQSRPPEPEVIRSPAELWRRVDPEALPLDVERIRAWDEDGCALEKLRFTGEVAAGAKTRVFAIQGAPVGNPRRLPGILQLHGGGQAASLAAVR